MVNRVGAAPTTSELKAPRSAVELPVHIKICGGCGAIRTPDLEFKRLLLYQLSYASIRNPDRDIGVQVTSNGNETSETVPPTYRADAVKRTLDSVSVCA